MCRILNHIWQWKQNFNRVSNTRRRKYGSKDTLTNRIFIQQSYYPNRQSAVGEQHFGTSGDVGLLSAEIGTDFGCIIGRPTTFFVEAPKLKVSLIDPLIYMSFVFGEASGDSRPMIGWQSGDVLKRFTSWSLCNRSFWWRLCVLSFGFRIFCWYRGFCHRTGSDLLLFLSWHRPKVAWSLGVNQPTIARRSIVEVLSEIRQQTDADVGRYKPRSLECRPIIKSCINLISGFISMDLVYKYHLGLFGVVWFLTYWTIRMTFWVFVSTSPKKIET